MFGRKSGSKLLTEEEIKEKFKDVELKIRCNCNDYCCTDYICTSGVANALCSLWHYMVNIFTIKLKPLSGFSFLCDTMSIDE